MSILSGIDTSSVDTSTKSGQSKQKLNEDMNQFLNMLVTQLQNQDPLDPMDANQFTTQLVQFASVEQQIQTNSNMESLLNVQQNAQVSSMVGYLGKVVEAKGNEFQMLNNQAIMTYDLPKDAAKVTLSFQDKNGNTLYTAEGDTASGTHTVGGDGSTNSGAVAPDGAYKLVVDATDKDGNTLDVSQTSYGYVTSTGASDGNVTVNMGDVQVDMADIISVELPVTGSMGGGSSTGGTSTSSSSTGGTSTGSTSTSTASTATP